MNPRLMLRSKKDQNYTIPKKTQLVDSPLVLMSQNTRKIASKKTQSSTRHKSLRSYFIDIFLRKKIQTVLNN